VIMASATLSSGAFDQIAADERTSGVKIEVKGVPGAQQDLQTACLVGQMLTGTATAGVPVVISGDGSAAATLFGEGSHLHRMALAFRAGNSVTPLYAVGLADPAGAAASQTVTLSGTATASGTLYFYVGLDKVAVAVTSDETAAALAAALVAAINASDKHLPVTAAAGAATGTVVLTARHKGLIGNEVITCVNLLGELGGQALPDGITVSGTGALAGGTGVPDQTPAIAGIQGAEHYYYVLGGWSDTDTLDAWSAEFEAMWTDARDLWGRVGFTARRGSLSELLTFGAARNDRFITCLGIYGTNGPSYETAARYAAQAARSLANHPARPLHELTLSGERSPEPIDRWINTDRKSLLWSGVATANAAPGRTMVIDRAITLYQRNAAGDRSDVWLDITTPATVGRIVNTVKTLIHDRFIAARCVLLDDDTADLVGDNVPCTSPKRIRATLVAHYDTLRRNGLVENVEAFKKLFQVGRDPDNPTRVNIIYTPDIANPLVTFAAQVKFCLQWPNDLVNAA